MSKLILHWVDIEVGAVKPFCGQQGKALMTHLKEANTCYNCMKKLTFLKRVREVQAALPKIYYGLRGSLESNLVSIESHKKGE